MPSTINASTASGGGIISSADSSGVLELQTAGTTALTVATSGNVGIGTSSPTLAASRNGLVVKGNTTNGGEIIVQTSVDTGSTGLALAKFGDNAAIVNRSNGNLAFGTNDTTRMSLNNSGTVILQDGNGSATGVGITFPTTQSASTDANTLDDYEEGTWAPSVYAASGSLTSFTIGFATYTKIGNTVYATARVRITNPGTASGALYITLPFSTPSNIAAVGVGRENESTGLELQWFVPTSSNAGVVFDFQNNSPIGINREINVNVTYIVST